MKITASCIGKYFLLNAVIVLLFRSIKLFKKIIGPRAHFLKLKQ